MAAKFNLFNLGGYGLTITERLQSLLLKYDIKIEGSEQDKLAILANALNTLAAADKLIEFKNGFEGSNLEFIKEQAIEERFKEMKLAIIIDKVLIQRFMEDAATLEAHKEKTKEAQLMINQLLAEIAAAKDNFQRELFDRQWEDLQKRIENITAMRVTTQARINELQKYVDKLDQKVTVAKTQKKQIIRDHSQHLAFKLDKTLLPSGQNIFANTNMEQKRIFSEKFIKMHHKKARFIERLKAKRKERLEKIRQAKAKLAKKPVGHRSSPTLTAGYANQQDKLTEQEINRLVADVNQIDQAITTTQKEEIIETKKIAKETGLNQIAIAQDEVVGHLVNNLATENTVVVAHENMNDMDDCKFVAREEKDKVTEQLTELEDLKNQQSVPINLEVFKIFEDNKKKNGYRK